MALDVDIPVFFIKVLLYEHSHIFVGSYLSKIFNY